MNANDRRKTLAGLAFLAFAGVLFVLGFFFPDGGILIHAFSALSLVTGGLVLFSVFIASR